MAIKSILHPIRRFIVLLILFALTTFEAAGQKDSKNEQLRLVVNTGHAKNITGAAFSPDGNFYATVDEIEVKLWETATGREVRSFAVGDDGASVSFSADGTLIAAEADKGVIIWETRTGKIVQFLKGYSKPVFGAGGKFLVALRSGNLKLLDPKTGEAQATLVAADESSAEQFALSADEKFLASVHDNSIKLWNLEKRSETGAVMKHQQGGIAAIDLSADGKTLASCGADGTTRLWDAASGVELHRLKLPVKDDSQNTFYTVRFSRDGKTMATGSLFGVHLWNVAEGVLEREIEIGRRTDALAFSPDGKTIIGGMLGGKSRVWQLSDGKLWREFNPDFDDVTAIAFAPNGKQLVSVSNAVSFWNFGDAAETKVLNERGHSLSFSADGKILALGEYRGVNLIDPTTAKNFPTTAHEKLKSLTFETLKNSAISPNGKIVAVGGGLFKPGPTTAYDTANGAVVRTFEGHEADTECLVFSADGKFLASAGGKTVKIADVETGKTLRVLNAASDGYSIIRAVAFNPQGDLLASGGLGEEIKIWRIADGMLLKTIKTDGYINSIVFSPDGKTVAAGLVGGKIVLWSAADGSLLKNIAAHFADVKTLAFHPNGKFLASGGEDGRLKIWDAGNGNPLVELLTINRKDWVAIAPDNRFETSAGGGEFLHWVVGVKVVSLEVHAAKYRTAGLLQKILAPCCTDLKSRAYSK